MNKNIITISIIAFIAFSGGFLAATAINYSKEPGSAVHDNNDGHHDMDEASGEKTGHVMGHEVKELDAQNAPKLSINVTKDNKSGYNLKLTTSNFKFAPENASSKDIDGEGHAHVYVDGKKINRLYGPDYYLGELSKGQHEIRVSLNTNDHRGLSVGGKAIEDTQTITVK